MPSDSKDIGIIFSTQSDVLKNNKNQVVHHNLKVYSDYLVIHRNKSACFIT
jgi:hypothetical protein